ncbi:MULTISPECIES: MSMEG_1061 family FMN-dependent PPOX-type flavoprotein [unclassified Rhodococcus (in: high G+C Gram-positive bacteria)]|uniref:MSMEG_1061 family FMN-dependent PPOX-type flavoprotein n=1 Tax=unclassified Rhodococcus (in: high G+C Gram-positive bacteria) TaxID=192944 RepID=UPI00146E6C9D|nr:MULTISPECIES: MSMEG_1061 family FMN-dependent PPOX-type flavoprotein [unclassified Rhodococcus (in: high G+C Gram-positive bacteria)]NMD95563.1 pyridoxamine 5'-phosphate oxidase family protein [Rhodococcus sp. BL-253-APC-6A1W]NME79559.1 pyridoxamine 5'-phosphate oxidase family protein [Rhodococcus sp. 105337]
MDADRIDELVQNGLSTQHELEAVLGAPHPAIVDKARPHLTPLIRNFLSLARFFTLATADAAGNCDCSPRGDLTSTVLVLDDHTIVLPDRPGNRRADSYRNILENPHVGLLFFVPGDEEVLRINGRATLSTDPELLEKLSLSGKPALLAVIVRIDEVFLHCARAMLRAKLWDAATYPKHELVPSMRDMHAELVSIDVPADAEAGKRELYREYLY